MDFAQHVGQGFGAAWQGIIFRRTYKQLDDIIDRTKKWYYQIFPGIKYNEANYTWKWPTGEKLRLRHMDSEKDYWNYHGHEIPFIGWEELTGWPDNKCYEVMKSCCRSSDPDVPRKYRANTNPWGIGMNWVKKYFVDPAPAGEVVVNEADEKRVRIHGSILENKVLLEADPAYLKKLNAISDPNRRKAWRDGDWNITAGGALDDIWDPNKHVFEPFVIPHTFFLNRSFDWGSARPFSVGWWAESDGSDVILANGNRACFPRGTVIRINELYGWNGVDNEGCRMTAAEIAQSIKGIENSASFRNLIGNNEIHKGPADNSIYTKENNMCIAADMKREGITWTESNKAPGSRIQGLEKVRRYLKNALERPMEKPGLVVFNTCRHFIRTVPTLPRDKRKLEDVETSAEDHCFHCDTELLTDDGPYKIGDLVGKEGYVLSAGGYYAKFNNCKITRIAAVNKVIFDDGFENICTLDHEYLTNDGWVESQNLIENPDEMRYSILSFKKRGEYICESRLLAALCRTLMEQLTIYANHTFSEKGSVSIGKFGYSIMEQFQKENVFTIKTAIKTITKLKILSCLVGRNTCPYMEKFKTTTTGKQQCRMVQKNGMEANMGLHGIKNNMQSIAKIKYIEGYLNSACNAASRMMASQGKSFAPITVNRHIEEKQEKISLKSNAFSAENYSKLRDIITFQLVREAVEENSLRQIGVKRVKPAGRSKVCCMNVEGLHSFALKNGAIVSNCYDELRYRLLGKRYKKRTQKKYK